MSTDSPTIQSPTSPTTNIPRHEKCHSKGGVQLKDDPDSKVNTREVILNIIKSVGSKLKEGKILDLLKVSRPACISYPKTYLQCVADDLVYTELLDKAVEAPSPITRMKYVMAFFTAGFHRNCCEMGSNGPLNPVLGETFITEKGGHKLYCEQITHHPPVSAYYMTNANGDYKLYGSGEVNAKLSGLNTIEGKRVGITTLEFKDGTKIIVENPEMTIEGIMMGDRIVNYHRSFKFIDVTNNLTTEMKFNFAYVRTISKIASGFKSLFSRSKNEKPPTDNFVVSIYDSKDPKKEFSSGGGSWLSFLEMDGEILWRIDQQPQELWAKQHDQKLASDSSSRLDSKFIKQKNYDQAQKEKDLLENNQRADAKLRKANEKAQAEAEKVNGKSLG